MPAPSSLKKRSVNIAGHSTSVTLEQIFWDSLRQIAEARGCPVAALIEEIDQARAEDPAAPNLSSAIRVFVLKAALER